MLKMLEARVGIEPTHNGFADHSLTTWVPRLMKIMPEIYAQLYAQRTLFLPIIPTLRLANPLKPRETVRA
jgi:hypothetical protein